MKPTKDHTQDPPETHKHGQKEGPAEGQKHGNKPGHAKGQKEGLTQGQKQAPSHGPTQDPPTLHTLPERTVQFYQKRKRGRFRLVEPPALEGPVADTHTHRSEDPALDLARCAAYGISFACLVLDPVTDDNCAFTQMDTWMKEARHTLREIAPALADTAKLPHVRIAVGVHPHNARAYDTALEAALINLMAHERVSCVGEIGLDYYYDYSWRDDQIRVFRRQLQLAKMAGLPVALHLRDAAPEHDLPSAHDDALTVLHDEGFPSSDTLVHCCTMSPEELKPWVDAGCYIAYGGALTFKKMDEARAGALLVPKERLLTETDAPYMTPEPMRGMPCTTAHVIFTAALLAQVRGQEPGENRRAFLVQLEQNARRLLDRLPTPWQLRHHPDLPAD